MHVVVEVFVLDGSADDAGGEELAIGEVVEEGGELL